ncbi:TPA: hypothetical protein ACRMSW_000212 [Pseudomonas aeruginosa]
MMRKRTECSSPRTQASLLTEVLNQAGKPAAGMVLLQISPDGMDEIAALRDLLSGRAATASIRMRSDALADQHGLVTPPALLITHQGIRLEARLCENGEAVFSPEISHDQLLAAAQHDVASALATEGPHP